MVTFSGYTPKNDVDKFNEDVEKSTKIILDNGFTSVTFTHDGFDIEVSVLDGDRHIDNVTGKYGMNNQ
jgi:hypothetical protein